jgi:ribosome maturation factor RimP
MSAVADRVEKAVAPVVAEAGLDLEAVEVQPAGRRRLVRVLVDRDGGISLDDVADLSKVLSETLDATDAMGDQPYVLEVTSPGVDRPLTLPRHWRRNLGRKVAVETSDGHRLVGRLVACDETRATLDTVDGAVEVGFDGVQRAQVEVEFSRPEEG